ncbi:Copia protein [Ooceraea biroi]|uniref:Copia protein n=1 Tax=Ooceraea biroi TaxID=2015173 RepID=A0A026WKN6_OOCBI|nr:Copia protein [Ooceraea biroi]
MRQSSYIDEVLKRFNMEECNPVSTPMDLGSKLDREEQSYEEKDLPYRELVGCLTYIATATRPDIAFVASYLGQFNSCYREVHWKAAKRVLRYLKGTRDIGLVFRTDSEPLRRYMDSD